MTDVTNIFSWKHEIFLPIKGRFLVKTCSLLADGTILWYFLPTQWIVSSIECLCSQVCHKIWQIITNWGIWNKNHTYLQSESEIYNM